MWADQFDATAFQAVTKPICVRHFVVGQPFDLAATQANIDQRFHRIEFHNLSDGDNRQDRNPKPVVHHHDPLSLSRLVLPASAPLFLQVKRFHPRRL
jgi:hypothetical protein